MDCRLTNISEGHQKNVISFLRFARQHRLQQLQTINATFHELQASRLTDDVYTIDEVVEMLDWLQTIIQSEVESEQMHLVHSSVLLMKQLFQQAETASNPLSLIVNIPQLDDRNLLEEISQFEQSAVPPGDMSSSSSLSSASMSSALTLLGLRSTSLEPINWSAMRKSLDSGMGIENEFIGNKDRMQHICRLLAVAFSIDDRGKINSLSDEYNEMLKISEKKENTETSQTTDRICVEACAEPTSANPGELKDGNEELSQLRDLLKKSEKELESKVSQTTPYKNLKRILQRKNEQLKDFRQRLSKYENIYEDYDVRPSQVN